MPEMKGGVAIEHGHRLAAGLVTLLTLAVAAVLIPHRRRHPRAWKLGWLAVGMVFLQAGLGAAGLFIRLPTPFSAVHMAVSLVFLLALVLIAVDTAPERTLAVPLPVRARQLSLVASISILFQMFLGGLVRHSGSALACPDLPFCEGSLWPADAHVTVHVHVVHRMGAMVVAALVAAASIATFRAARDRTWLRALAVTAPILVVAQFVLGVNAVKTALGLGIVVAHLAVGALLLGVQWVAFLASASTGQMASSRSRSALEVARDLLELTKPRITGLVVATFGGALWLAPASVATWRVVMTLLGTVFIVSAANALNMYLERDVDGLMDRTRNRPLPQGRLSPDWALALGTTLVSAALPLLLLGSNLLTAALGVLAFALYVWAYTPLKRRSSAALFVGAIPGAMPPLMGWTSATGRFDAPGLVLFAILFLWQIPHFLAIALYRSGDYERAGFRVMPLCQSKRATWLNIVGFSVALVIATLLLTPLHVTGGSFMVMALVLGAAFVGWGVVGFRRMDSRPWARSLFLGSIVYLTLLFIALALTATAAATGTP